MKFGSDIQAFGKLEFAASSNYIKYNSAPGSAAMEFYVGNTKAMSIDATGGDLHGTWEQENAFTTSDRRLKKNIQPLTQTLRRVYAEESRKRAGGLSTDTAPAWVLRQLRPVSYNFKQGSDSKNVRFGFIVDEIEKVLPEVIRETPPKEDEEKPKKGIVYGDLIAVLTSVVKDFSEQLKGLQGRMRTAEDELARLDEEEPMDDFEGAGFRV
jgi:hypothetical protein